MQEVAATQVKDAVEVIRLVQSIIPNYDERRREGADGYFEGTRLQELDMIRSWLNGAIECLAYFLWNTVLFTTLFSCNSALFWFVLAPINQSDFPAFAPIFYLFCIISICLSYCSESDSKASHSVERKDDARISAKGLWIQAGFLSCVNCWR